MPRRAHGMALNAPGGFSKAEWPTTPCTLCGRMAWFGWYHALTGSLVCDQCLPDPYAEEPREVKLDARAKPQPVKLMGEVIGARVRTLAGHTS